MSSAAVGIDLGGTKIASALVDEAGHIMKSSRVATDVNGGPSAVLEQIKRAVEELSDGADDRPIGVGIGVAGQIEAGTGVVRFAPNLDWHDVPLQSDLSASVNLPVDLPVVITNDVRAITWGEWLFGAGKGCNDLICAFVGTGIGGGVVVNGKVISGCTNTAGEIGHLTVDLRGPACTCGNHGCMEALAGGWAIARKAQQAVSGDAEAGAELLQMAAGELAAVTAKMVTKAYKQGDPLAKAVITEAGGALVAGMVSLVNAFNPCRLILGGGVIDGLPVLVEWVEKGVRAKALAAATGSLQVLQAQLGDRAGVIGAAALAIKSFGNKT